MTLEADAYAVLLPAIPDLTLTGPLRRFLDQGGLSLLLGESRAEYLARRMSDARQANETAAMIARTTAASNVELAQTSSSATTPCFLYDTPKAAANSAPAMPIRRADAIQGDMAPSEVSRYMTAQAMPM